MDVPKNGGRNSDGADKLASSSVLSSGRDADIDAQLWRGVYVLRASGRLRAKDDASDLELVLAIVDAVFPL